MNQRRKTFLISFFSYCSSKKNFFCEKRSRHFLVTQEKIIFFPLFLINFIIPIFLDNNYLPKWEKWGFLKYHLHKNNIWPQFYFFLNTPAISIVQKLISCNLISSTAELASMFIEKRTESSLFPSNVLKSFVSFKWK